MGNEQIVKRTILVVEDDKKMADLIRLYLERDHHQVVVIHDGQQAVEMARQKRPDLIVLDLMLPGLDGLDVCRTLRAESRNDVAIIMLTARSTEEDKLTGLNLGADDYVTKPFSPRELVARVRAALRRVSLKPESHTIRAGRLTLDLEARKVFLKNETLHLTPKEFKLLALLVQESGRALTRRELADGVLGIDHEGFDRTIDVHVMNLRKKIEPDPAHPIYLQTVFGVGYRFADDANEK